MRNQHSKQKLCNVVVHFSCIQFIISFNTKQKELLVFARESQTQQPSFFNWEKLLIAKLSPTFTPKNGKLKNKFKAAVSKKYHKKVKTKPAIQSKKELKEESESIFVIIVAI